MSNLKNAAERIDATITGFARAKQWLEANAGVIGDMYTSFSLAGGTAQIVLIADKESRDESRELARQFGGIWRKVRSGSVGFYDYEQENDGFKVSILTAEPMPAPIEPEVLVL